MTRERVLSWLASREPAAPPPLRERLERFVGEVPGERLGSTMTEAMSALCTFALEASLAKGEAGDEAAMDLLAADALVTYAFESAAEEGVEVNPVATKLLVEVVR